MWMSWLNSVPVTEHSDDFQAFCYGYVFWFVISHCHVELHVCTSTHGETCPSTQLSARWLSSAHVSHSARVNCVPRHIWGGCQAHISVDRSLLIYCWSWCREAKCMGLGDLRPSSLGKCSSQAWSGFQRQESHLRRWRSLFCWHHGARAFTGCL